MFSNINNIKEELEESFENLISLSVEQVRLVLGFSKHIIFSTYIFQNRCIWTLSFQNVSFFSL